MLSSQLRFRVLSLVERSLQSLDDLHGVDRNGACVIALCDLWNSGREGRFAGTRRCFSLHSSHGVGGRQQVGGLSKFCPELERRLDVLLSLHPLLPEKSHAIDIQRAIWSAARRQLVVVVHRICPGGVNRPNGTSRALVARIRGFPIPAGGAPGTAASEISQKAKLIVAEGQFAMSPRPAKAWAVSLISSARRTNRSGGPFATRPNLNMKVGGIPVGDDLS